MPDAPSAPSAAASPWIVGPRYDLGWFFGGAAVSLLALGLCLGAGVPIVVLWWTWILAFDGPHIAAAFTRTYVDLEEWTLIDASLGSLHDRCGMALNFLCSHIAIPPSTTITWPVT